MRIHRLVARVDCGALFLVCLQVVGSEAGQVGMVEMVGPEEMMKMVEMVDRLRHILGRLTQVRVKRVKCGHET